MKKPFAMFYAFTLCCGILSGCDGKNSDSKNSKDNGNISSVVSTPTENSSDLTSSTDSSLKEENSSETGSKAETLSSSSSDNNSSNTNSATVSIPAVELSEELYDFEFAIDGEKYKLPFSYADMTDRGWEYKGDKSVKLQSGQYILSQTARRDGAEIFVGPTNISDSEISVTEAQICNLRLDEYSFKDDSSVIQIAKGIVINRSNLDEVKAAFGTPAKEDMGIGLSAGIVLTYEKKANVHVIFFFNKENVLTKITMQNIDIS